MDERNTDYEHIREALTRAVRRICPPWMRAQCEDLVQSSLLRIVEVQGKRGEDRELSPSYLWRVAYSALIDEIRRRRVRPEVALDPEAHGDPPAPLPDPERRTAGRAIGRAVLDCLATLIDTRRRAMALYLRGLTARRAAELMGWSPRQAENLILRGRKDLRQCLSGKGWEL